MLDDVAMVNVGLRRINAVREIILCPDPGELSRISFEHIFEAALGRISRPHRAGRKRSWIDPAGDATRAAVGGFICLRVKRCAPDHLERNEVVVDRMRVSSYLDVNP